MNEPRAVRAPDRRQSRCPACGDGRGVLLSSHYRAGMRTLSLWCPVCAKAWTPEPSQYSVVNPGVR